MRTYISIDLKSFYASVECVERNFDPLTTNLVVADMTRTEKTICLAVSPSLKAHGISGRARMFEVIQKVKEVNSLRLENAVKNNLIQKNKDGKYSFTGTSFDAPTLKADPSLELSYYIAPPRMKLYEEYSTKIYSVYLKYISPEDIHVYSIDEVFIDATPYLKLYGMNAHELAMAMIREVLYTTGITATAGIGTNLYLAKVAMDIVAKHVPADRDGVRIAQLDEYEYRKKLWCHTPLTDFWRIGGGYSSKLSGMGLYTMGDIAQFSMTPKGEDILYKMFGINAELLIDHAWGYEPVTIKEIKAYRPETKSLSSGQVLKEPYDYESTMLIVREMIDLLSLDLVKKGLLTNQIVLNISYDRESLIFSDGIYTVKKTGEEYLGKISKDPYGRIRPSHSHGTENIDDYTSSSKRLTEAVLSVYKRIVDPDLLVRRINISACRLISVSDVPKEKTVQLSLFDDPAEIEKKEIAEKRERKLQEATLFLQSRYGKNKIIKGMNLKKGATTIERNTQIGGHRSE